MANNSTQTPDLGKVPQVCQAVLPWLWPGGAQRTTRQVLKLASNPQSDVSQFIQAVQAKPIFKKRILAYAGMRLKKSRWHEPEERDDSFKSGSFGKMLASLGARRIRNLAICLDLDRSADQLTGRVSPEIAWRARMQFSLRCEGYANDRRLAYRQAIFVAGLHYDYLMNHLMHLKLWDRHQSLVSSTFEKSLVRALHAYEFGQAVKKKIIYQRYLFSAALLFGIGEILYELVDSQSNSALLKKQMQIDETSLTWLAIAQRSRTGIDFGGLASMWVAHLKLFPWVEKPLFYSMRPFDVMVDEEQFQIAGIIHLVLNDLERVKKCDTSQEILRLLGGDNQLLEDCMDQHR